MKFRDPKIGDTRITAGFCFLPKYIAGESRWLERAMWFEEYKQTKRGRDWVAVRWAA